MPASQHLSLETHPTSNVRCPLVFVFSIFLSLLCLLNFFSNQIATTPSMGLPISQPIETIPSRQLWHHFTQSKEAVTASAGEDSPSFPFLRTIFIVLILFLSITMLRTVHGPLDCSARRHIRVQLPPMPSSPPFRGAATASAGEDLPSFPFLKHHFHSC